MLDEKGFKRKTYDDLLTEIEMKGKELFGEDINTSTTSFFGIFFRLFAYFLAIVWMLAEKVYNSAFISKADGVSLDRLVLTAGISRQLDQQAIAKITVNGSPEYIVSEGTLITNRNETIYFEVLEDFQIGANGTGIGYAICTEFGTKGNVDPNMLTVLVNTDSNITSVTNEKAYGGTNKETDRELRAKHSIAISGIGSSTINAIRTALLRVNGVRAATVIQNVDDVPDASGRPAHSIEAFLLGGNPSDIGYALLNSKAAGIRSHGSQSIDVIDDSGNHQTMKFSFAEEVDIQVQMTITKNDQFEADGDKQVKDAIVRYIGGTLSDGYFSTGLNMGEDLNLAQLLFALSKVKGIADVDLAFGKKGQTLGTDKVVINANQVAQITAEDVIINVS